MKTTLPIDPFNLTQGFGERPAAYARFGLKGHNGWDIKTKYPDTPKGFRYFVAPQDCTFYKRGNEGSDGYGLYLEVITKTSKNTWKHTFAHNHSVEAFTQKKQGENLGITDNTGNSSASHLHWTTKRLNPDGSVRDYNNGYFGAVNPQEYIDEVRADSQDTPPSTIVDPNLQHKASAGDRIWSVFNFNGKTLNQSTEKDHLEFVEWIKDNVRRAGTYDKICDRLKLPHTSTADEVLSKASNRENIIAELKDKLIALIKSFK